MQPKKTHKLGGLLPGICLLLLLMVGAFSTNTRHYPDKQPPILSAFADPLGHFEGSGLPGILSWTGDGNRISNPSFEGPTLSPWIPSQYNAAVGSSIAISKTAYDGKNSTQLTLLSGNLTSNSYVSLQNDLAQAQAGFSSSVRLRAVVLIQQLTGMTAYDRIELRLTLTSSTGLTRAIHYLFASGSNLPANSITDAYYDVGPAPLGQWVTLDRNVAQDASNAFPSDYPSFNSVAQAALIVLAQTQPGPPNHDPHIKYWNFNPTLYSHWQNPFPVIYDADNNGLYDIGDTILGGCNPPPCTTPPVGTPLADDSLIRYVDSNNNGVWDTTEPVVYDSDAYVSNNGIYDFYDPVIYAIPQNPPVLNALLIKVFQNRTTALFDRVELYSATGGSEWVRNGGFETGLTGWVTNSSSFTTTTSPVLSGTQSAMGSITNGAGEMAQSIDGRPVIDSSTVFTASANVTAMSGTSGLDMVDIWLGLVDSRDNPVSLYYVFMTGDGSIPNNRTDAVYLKAPNQFGTPNQWLTVYTNLSDGINAFNLLGYTPPYKAELMVVEIDANGPSASTTAYFDDLSLRTKSYTGTAPSKFYAVDGLNTTYLYAANAIPHGSLHLEITLNEAVLNITSPEASILQKNEYTVSPTFNCLGAFPCCVSPSPLLCQKGWAIDVPDITLFKHAPVGDWKFFTTASNTIANVYVEDPVSHTPASNLKVGSTVNFVSQSKSPPGLPLPGVPVNLTLWNTNTGIEVKAWPGSSNPQGWWNVSSVTLPLTDTPPGSYSLQATVMLLYAPEPVSLIGIRTFQVSVRYTVELSLGLSSPQASTGSSITITGTATQAGTPTPAPGVNVTISYRLAGNSQWTILGTVNTDASGKYSYAWNPPEGEYEVMASTGDTQTAPAQSTRAQLLVGPAGFLQGPWPIVIAGVVAAAAVLLIVVTLQQKRAQAPKPPH